MTTMLINTWGGNDQPHQTDDRRSLAERISRVRPGIHRRNERCQHVPTNPTQTVEKTARRQRLHRSELAVPGSNVKMLERAPGAGADIVMLDLEDAVAPNDKPQARLNIIDALQEQDWSGCSVSLRINGLDTHWCYRDLVDVVEEAGRHLDQIMIPKVSGAGDVHLV